MSEATDATREVEDFFTEEIFGVPARAEAPPIVPTEAPPEPKPVEEAAVEEPVEVPAEEPAEEEIETEMIPESIPEADEEVEGEEEYLAWAKKQYGDDLDLTSDSSRKLAKAAFEKERMLGKKAEEAKTLRQEQEARELQERIDALTTHGALTPEEDSWVDEALSSNDPAEWAYAALQSERPDLYSAILDRWASLGEQESRQARVFHSRVLQAVSAPQPSEEETYSLALGQTFLSIGLNIERDGPAILAKAEELGPDHPAVQGMMSPDDNVRLISTRAVYDLIAAGKTSVQKAKTEDVIDARVKEETLRQQAAGVTAGGRRVEQPKKSSFWDQFDQEIAERGWDGKGPSYPRE